MKNIDFGYLTTSNRSTSPINNLTRRFDYEYGNNTNLFMSEEAKHLDEKERGNGVNLFMKC